MPELLTAPLVLGAMGLFFGALLAVAQRLLRVDEDPRIERVEGLLPGSNCGACGEPGCRALAEKLAAGAAAPSRCTVASRGAIEAIAAFLGVDPGQEAKRVARLHCAGGLGRAVQVATYEGLETCRAAHLVGGGGLACSWGCLGLADCEVACTFAAIRMSPSRLPLVDVEACTACGDCVVACPRDLFEILPLDHHLLVQCKAPLTAEEARRICKVVCDACGRCAADAPPGLIRMEGGLPVIDYAAGGPASPEATRRCPTGAIRWVVGEQLSELATPAEARRG